MAVTAGKIEVQQDEIGPDGVLESRLAVDVVQSLKSVLDHTQMNLHAGRAQGAFDQLRIRGIVLNQEDFDGAICLLSIHLHALSPSRRDFKIEPIRRKPSRSSGLVRNRSTP